MFVDCSSLISIDLTSFETSQIYSTTVMFQGCSKLEYINLKNFNENSLNQYDNMFAGVPKNVVICINVNRNKILSKLGENSGCYIRDCSGDWKTVRNRIIAKTGDCIDKCENHALYKYEYNGKCYDNCVNGYATVYINNKAVTQCKCELEECLTCPLIDLNIKLCNRCNTDFYRIENEPLYKGEYFNCYKNPKGYYLDKDDSLYKKCYYTCDECEIKGNNTIHNCLVCKSNYPFSINFNNYSNCYEDCSYYYYFDNESNFHCTTNLSCPEEYQVLREDSRECINDEINSIKTSEIIDEDKELSSSEIIIETQKYIKNLDINDIKQAILDYGKNKTEIKERKEEIEYYDEIMKIIENIFTSSYFNTEYIDQGLDQSLEIKKMTLFLTTTKIQKESIHNNNRTAIDLGECENILRSSYNLLDNETIYMKIFYVKEEGMKIPKILYELYHRKSGTNLTRLNLSVCENNKIDLYIPLEISEDLDLLNISSSYYNNICHKATSDSGTDIILKDRRKEFVDGNKTVCQEDCDFSEYDSINQKVKCSCEVKENLFSFENMNINKTKLLINF